MVSLAEWTSVCGNWW